MTTLNQARSLVYQRFLDLWAGASAVTFENEAFDPPANGNPWIRVSVRNFLSEQACLAPPGFRRFDRIATTFVQVFTKPDTGTKAADTLARLAQQILEGVTFGGLRFRAVTIREVGVDDGWHAVLVEAPFWYEETK